MMEETDLYFGDRTFGVNCTAIKYTSKCTHSLYKCT